MTPADRAVLLDNLKTAEGYRRLLYLDTKQIWTVGYGRNMQHVGVSEPEAAYLLNNDVTEVLAKIHGVIPDFEHIDGTRQIAFGELVVNMGAATVAKFHKMLAAVAGKNWTVAADELMASKWKDDVGPTRSSRLERMVRTGTL